MQVEKETEEKAEVRSGDEWAVAQKLETQNQKEDQISIRTTPDNAESEVFSHSRRFFHDVFFRKIDFVIFYIFVWCMVRWPSKVGS